MGSTHASTQHFEAKRKQKATVRRGSSNCWISNQDKGRNDLCRVILFRLAPLSQQLYSHNTAAFVPDQRGGSRALHHTPYVGPDLPSHGPGLLTRSGVSSSITAAIQPQQAYAEHRHVFNA